jgi:hypothetical protein
MSLRDVGTIKDTTTITLQHPATGKSLLNADGTPMTVVLHGPYSERYKSVLRDQQQRRMTEMGRGTRATMSPDELDAFASELLVRCIDDWSITLEGDEKLPFSADAVESVMAEFPWVKDQINAVMGNIADFLEPPKPH